VWVWAETVLCAEAAGASSAVGCGAEGGCAAVAK
jgi:hypothetical protein